MQFCLTEMISDHFGKLGTSSLNTFWEKNLQAAQLEIIEQRCAFGQISVIVEFSRNSRNIQELPIHRTTAAMLFLANHGVGAELGQLT